MSKNSRDDNKSIKDVPSEDDTDVMKIVEEQKLRNKLQRQGLPSQGQRPDNDAPVVSNGEREALAIRQAQSGFYQLPEDMLPSQSDKDE